jgi:hypothetical protein
MRTLLLVVAEQRRIARPGAMLQRRIPIGGTISPSVFFELRRI